MKGADSAPRQSFFCDTSVLVAAADLRHVHHVASVAVVRTAERKRAFCSAHTIAELYATLTSLVYRDRLRLADVAEVVSRTRATFTVVGLTGADYFAVVQDALLRGLQSGQIYDALHLGAAAKVDPDTIYTWNMKHFEAVAPSDLVGRIRTP